MQQIDLATGQSQ